MFYFPRPGPRVTDIDHHPGPAIAALMKLSFDEEHRHAICTLGELILQISVRDIYEETQKVKIYPP